MDEAMTHTERLRTIVLINVASVLEKCDEQILPALYSKVGASFEATPTQLGKITLARAFMQALSSPLAGVISQFKPRGTVIGLGCGVWALFTALFACVSSLTAALPLCAMNGIGLALVIPSVQSLTADLNASQSRGRAFGALWLTISFGGMLGALYATNVGAFKPFGMEGWRFVFLSVALLSATAGVLNHMFVHDAHYVNDRSRQREDVNAFDLTFVKAVARDILHVLRIPTFSLIILQGIVGSVPYASLVFLTLYLQLLGMTDGVASFLVALYLIGGGLGGLVGGWVGDLAASKYPNHGRILATQFSVFIGIPFAFIIFKTLPESHSASSIVLYGFVIFLFSVLTAWPAPCANNPIFAEIVPPSHRNLVYSFDRCFEGAVAAFATPLVGLMSERIFGFSGTSTVSGDPEVDIPNAHALGKALLAFLAVPWLFCFIVYSGIHFTYPKDRHNAVVKEKVSVQHGRHQDENTSSERATLLALSEEENSAPSRRNGDVPLQRLFSLEATT